jgi:TonB-dependent SusC/RagA subfamily outer membrane receptor
LSAWFGRAIGAALFACAISSITSAQNNIGRITARVTDRELKTPIDAAQIVVDGTTIAAMTNASGTVTISRITAGSYQLRVVRLGYESALLTVRVTAGATTNAEFALARSPYQLESVVTTATGRQLTRELGHALTKLDVRDLVKEQPITNLQDLLNGRVAGVTMMASNGTIGGGARVRIRGMNSLALSNDPLIIVDGIRIEESSPALGGTLYIGGGRPNFMNNLNPEEIENIEIAKGPAASTLYGTQGANGVIVITTKRGRAGPPKWLMYAEGGLARDPADYPNIYYSAGRSPSGAARNCLQWMSDLGACTIDQTYSRNLLEDPETTPIGTGSRQQYGAQLSGGSEATRYFVSGDWESELGLLRMPNSERDSLLLERGVDGLPRRQEIPNQLTKTNIRTNLGLTLSHMAELNVSSGFGHAYNLLPQTGDNLQSVIGSAMTGVPNPALLSVWGYAPPRDVFSKSVARKTNQFINSGTLQFRPSTWLDTRATAGLDWMQYDDEADVAIGQGCKFCGIERTGLRTINKWNNLKYTIHTSGTASFSLPWQLTSYTSLGAQLNRDGRYGTLNTAQRLAPGGRSIDAGSDRTSGERTAETVSYGTYIEQRIGWREKLYLTAAVRRDQNSAFGSALGGVTYPKVALSYIARETDAAQWLNHLRVRGALGVSGQQPTATAAITQLTPTTATVFSQGDVPAVTFGALGNDRVRPERTREIEGGFDATLLHNRVSLSVTYYDKKTTDALVDRLLPGSLGAGASRVENVGVVSNRGFEVSLSARVIDRDDIRYDVGIEASGNRNRLEQLAPGVRKLGGFGYENRPGYPLFGLWWPKIAAYGDVNHNGSIDPNEVWASDTAVFMGSSVPIRTLTATSHLGVLRDRLRFSALVDFRGGFVSHNINNLFQCVFVQNCAALHVAGYDLKEQAKAVVGVRAFGAYAEHADFVKLREVSATYAIPQAWLSRVRIGSAAVVLTARNVATWSRFNSWDPENNTSGVDGPNYNFVQLAQPRVYLVRLNLGF